MVHLSSWFSKDIAIDLGTANTLIHVSGKGIVLNEPSVVAIDTQNNNIFAVGQEAKTMVGMTPERIKIIRPLRDGVIVDFKVTEVMLKYFIKKVLARNRLRCPRIVIAVPLGITDVEKKAVRDSASQVSANEVTIILEPMAAALGAGLPILKPAGNMVVDVGGGTTEVAIISLAGIVSGYSIRVAGDEMDEAIIQYVKQKYNLLIGLKTAEFVKKIIGTAYPIDSKDFVEVCGRDLVSGMPGIQQISSEEIQEALTENVLKIVMAIRLTLEKTPPELFTDIMKQGIILTGGGALLRNLDYRIKEETKIPVALADDPLSSVVLGTAKVMSDRDLLERVAVE